MKIIKQLFIGLGFLICIVSCEKEEIIEYDGFDKSRVDLYSTLKDVYYWNYKIPNINPSDYSNYQDLLYATMYKEVDKWSFIEKTEIVNEWFKSSTVTSYGIGLKVYLDAIIIKYVYPTSPLQKFGIERGWRILKINGIDATYQNIFDLIELDGIQFQMINNKNEIVNFTSNKASVEVNSVFYSNIYTVNNRKVGYMVFNSFVESSEQEINKVFADFKKDTISDLILDLRYNGGGLTSVANYLASSIARNVSPALVFAKYRFNENNKNENFDEKFIVPSYPLSLPRLFVLTTDGTASASEEVINGLKPYIEVITIGTKTHGKPVGMIPLPFIKQDGKPEAKYTLVAIMFSIKNALDQGDYYDGLPPNVYVNDDYQKALGDTNEVMLSAALEYIQFRDVNNKKSTENTPKSFMHENSFKQLTGVY